MNKEICHSDDGLWKVKTEYIVKKDNNIVFLTNKMFKLLVILFIIKLYARVNISLQNIFYFSKGNNFESALKLLLPLF